MTRALILLLALIGAARAEPTVVPTEDRSWHLLQKQYDGLIRSVQHGLTQHECEFAKARILGEPATDEEKAAAAKLEAERKARDKATREAWEAVHPGCRYGWPSDNDPPGCPKGAILGSSISGGFLTMHNMTDISSAECFQ